MDSLNKKPAAADSVKPGSQPRHTQPVRLPIATAELVDRLLAARCGASR